MIAFFRRPAGFAAIVIFLAAIAVGIWLLLSRQRPERTMPIAKVPYPAPGPCSGVGVNPGDDLRALIKRHRGGTTFCVLSGVHRLATPLVPKRRQVFIGETGSILSGAVVLSDWKPNGKYWVISGQTQQSSPGVDRCTNGTQVCRYAEDVFIDDRRMKRVMSRAELSTGEFYFDYDDDKIYIADDPTGHTLEAAVSPGAFKNGGNDVTIQNLVIEKFANNAQSQGAIDSREVSGWLVVKVTSRLNHGRGITPGPGRVIDSSFLHNGQSGVGGQVRGLVIESSEVAYNNEVGLDPEWEAGGLKLGASESVVLRNNYVHDNDGPGLWADESCRNFIFEGNRVENNTKPGIFHEISYGATIRNNIVLGNGFGKRSWGWGAGIQVVASGGAGHNAIEIYGNTVTDNYNGISLIQQDRGEGKFGPHVTQNIYVHDNTITMRSGRTGAYDDTDGGVFGKNNRFESNSYFVPEPTGRHWAWRDEVSTWMEWQAAGNDRSGRAFALADGQ